MKRRPPVVATWLLQTFGSDPRNDQIVGDLIEQYSRGRSPFWYWRQAMAAIVTGFFDQIRANWLVTLGALLTGWGAWFILNSGLTAGLERLVNPWEAQSPALAALLWWTAWLANRAISGWTIGRFYGKGRVAFVLLLSLTVFVWKAKMFEWPFYIDYQWPLQITLNTHEEFHFFLGLLSMILAPLFVLFGGLFGAAPRRQKGSALEMGLVE